MRSSTPLLGGWYTHRQDERFPFRQLLVLGLCRIGEPIAFMSIFPYVYDMVRSFVVTKDESRLSQGVGMLIAAFPMAEFATAVFWGRMSDRVGRKPVLILGLTGTAVSMVWLGLARSLTSAIWARILGGLLNGNAGVLQTTVAELVKEKEHEPRAFSIMPFVWCLGSVLGPAMSGVLAMPCEAYPSLFVKDGIFDTYPFLLPNLVCAMVLLFGIVNGVLFLEETQVGKKRQDCSVGARRWLVRKTVANSALPHVKSSLFESDDQTPFDPPPGDGLTDGSSKCSTAPHVVSPNELESGTQKTPSHLTRTFHRQVILIIVGNAILAYHSISFDSLMPIFLSETASHVVPSLPFSFDGGVGLSTTKIGFLMAAQGVYATIAQLWFFPFLLRRVRVLTALRAVMTVWPILYVAVPYIVFLPTHLHLAGVYFCLFAKTTFQVIAFPSNAILLTNASSSASVLATINGVFASTTCLARAFGPAITGAVHSFGLTVRCSGMAWWVTGFVGAIGAVESFFIEERPNRHHRSGPAEHDICEPFLGDEPRASTERPPRG